MINGQSDPSTELPKTWTNNINSRATSYQGLSDLRFDSAFVLHPHDHVFQLVEVVAAEGDAGVRREAGSKHRHDERAVWYGYESLSARGYNYSYLSLSTELRKCIGKYASTIFNKKDETSMEKEMSGPIPGRGSCAYSCMIKQQEMT